MYMLKYLKGIEVSVLNGSESNGIWCLAGRNVFYLFSLNVGLGLIDQRAEGSSARHRVILGHRAYVRPDEGLQAVRTSVDVIMGCRGRAERIL